MLYNYFCRIEWDAFDYHSGISNLQWRLFDNHTNILHDYDVMHSQGESSVNIPLVGQKIIENWNVIRAFFNIQSLLLFSKSMNEKLK